MADNNIYDIIAVLLLVLVLVAQCCTYPFDLIRRRLQALHKPELMTQQEKVRSNGKCSQPRLATKATKLTKVFADKPFLALDFSRYSQAFLEAARRGNPVLNFSIYRAISFIVQSEGWAGLYRGVSLNFMKTAPAMSISFTCYDLLRSLLGVPSGKFSATTA